MRTVKVLLISTALLILLSGCNPAAVDTKAIETQVAGKIYSTLTASAPTTAPSSTSAPTLAPSSIPTPAPVPTAEAVVLAATLNMREGPDTSFPILLALQRDEKLSVTGKYQNCEWMQVKKSSGEQGWIKIGSGYASVSGDCAAIPAGFYRPLNGSMIKDTRTANGPGTLTVGNGLDSDGMVAMMDKATTVLIIFYVHGKESYTLQGIPDGDYQVFFTLGKDWSWEEKTFTPAQSTRKFDDSLTYTTANGTYTTFSLTLHSVSGGSAKSTEIDPATFPTTK